MIKLFFVVVGSAKCFSFFCLEMQKDEKERKDYNMKMPFRRQASSCGQKRPGEGSLIIFFIGVTKSCIGVDLNEHEL
jgi:hypothetical protein